MGGVLGVRRFGVSTRIGHFIYMYQRCWHGEAWGSMRPQKGGCGSREDTSQQPHFDEEEGRKSHIATDNRINFSDAAHNLYFYLTT